MFTHLKQEIVKVKILSLFFVFMTVSVSASVTEVMGMSTPDGLNLAANETCILALKPDPLIIIEDGGTGQFMVALRCSGSPLPGVLISFSSADNCIASVTSASVTTVDGKARAMVTGHNPGITQVTAAVSVGADSVSGTATVIVLMKPLLSPGFFWPVWHIDPPRFEGIYDEVYENKISLEADMEFPLSSNLSLLFLGGSNSYKSSTGDALNIINTSLNGKLYLDKGVMRFFINGGAGYYWFNPGENDFGFNFGGGLQFWLGKHWALEAGYNYHHIFNPGKDTQFSFLRTGIKFR
ncbi:hypothetical protein ACFLQP_00825 [Acidobacteriota bacterium]